MPATNNVSYLMAGKVHNIKACGQLNRSEAKLMTEGNKLRNGLTGNYHAPESFRDGYYSCNLPLITDE